MEIEGTGSWEKRPWGRYLVIIEGTGFKVKVIEVSPGMRLSYQSHENRSERWVITDGNALITIDGDEIRYSKGDMVKIEMRQKHRVRNIGDDDLRFVEVQMGGYLGEDDIIRYEDDFGRP